MVVEVGDFSAPSYWHERPFVVRGSLLGSAVKVASWVWEEGPVQSGDYYSFLAHRAMLRGLRKHLESWPRDEIFL